METITPKPMKNSITSVTTIAAGQVNDEVLHKEYEHHRFSDTLSTRHTVFCVLLLICMACQSFNPMESYLPKFLMNYKGFSKSELTLAVFPLWSYGYFIALFPLSLITEYLIGYANGVLLSLLFRLCTHLLVPFGRTLLTQQLAQLSYGSACSLKVAFGAYAYSRLPPHLFLRLTGMLRAASLFSHVLAGCIGWLLKKFAADWFYFYTLTQISIIIAVCVLIFAIHISPQLCNSGNSTTNNVRGINDVSCINASNTPSTNLSHSSSPTHILKTIYSSSHIILWSAWSIVSFALLELCLCYSTLLFETVDASNTDNNGLVGALARLASTCTTLSLTYIKQPLQSFGVYFMVTGSVIVSGLFLVMSFTGSLTACYMAFVGVCAFTEIGICAATASVAISTPTSLRAIALFLNTSLTMGVHTIINIASGERFLTLCVRQRFLLYACISATLSPSLAILHYVLTRPKTQLQNQSECNTAMQLTQV